MQPPAPTEIVPFPGAGRRFAETVRTGVGDVGATGRLRLDAIARLLQDVALRDVVDAGDGNPEVWLQRRLRLDVRSFPGFLEELELTTWCSAIGPAIAERRTTITGAAGGHVEAVALWISIDLERMRPRAHDDAFVALYEPSADGRRARSRLHHPITPPATATPSDFAFRAADLDPAAHVNNAVYWAVLEEELTTLAPATALDVELEHRSPGSPGPAVVHSDGPMRWVTGADGTLLATFALHDDASGTQRTGTT